MAYDPIDDEKRMMTMSEWEHELREAVVQYRKDLDGKNAFTAEKHTFDEWMGSFKRYMSF